MTSSVRFHRCPQNCPTEEISRGDHVKVSRKGERFWVKVTSSSSKRICGTVDNELAKGNLKYGQKVCFPRNKVYDVAHGKSNIKVGIILGGLVLLGYGAYKKYSG